MESDEAQGRMVVGIDAAVLDIGLAGIAVETETRLPPQRNVALRLRDEGQRGSDELAVRGRTVWCFFHGTAEGSAGEPLPVYRAGIEFTDVLTPVAESLVRFLEGHALAESGESRLFGRFRLAGSERVRIESESPFRLLALEAGVAELECGLLIEVAPGTPARLVLGEGALEGHLTDLARAADRPDRWRVRVAFDSIAEAESRLRPLAGGGA
jgi:hypothetical protein